MIRAEGLTLTAPGGLRVLDGASFEVGEGEALLVTGPTGSGKTTLLYAIGGLLEGYLNGSYNGTLLVDGMSPQQALREHRVLYVPQEPSNSFLGFDVYTELRWRGASDERIAMVADRLSIKGLLKRRVYELSGGEAQKAAIAFALASGYKLALLDEPLANLDERSRAELVGLIGELMKEGMSFVIAEHRSSYFNGKGIHRLELPSQRGHPGEFPLKSYSVRGSGMAVEARGLSYSYDGRPALKGLDLEVKYGEAVALVGDNGTGKSTVIKLLAGLLKGPKFKREYRRAGFALQTPELQFIEDSVEGEASLEAVESSFVVPLLGYMGLLGHRSSLPHSLSRGQRVRLAVASAALKMPEILLLDEPTEGQDRAGIEAMKGIIKWAKSSGSAVLLVTQELWFAREVADRVVRLGNGG